MTVVPFKIVQTQYEGVFGVIGLLHTSEGPKKCSEKVKTCGVQNILIGGVHSYKVVITTSIQSLLSPNKKHTLLKGRRKHICSNLLCHC